MESKKGERKRKGDKKEAKKKKRRKREEKFMHCCVNLVEESSILGDFKITRQKSCNIR